MIDRNTQVTVIYQNGITEKGTIQEFADWIVSDPTKMYRVTNFLTEHFPKADSLEEVVDKMTHKQWSILLDAQVFEERN